MKNTILDALKGAFSKGFRERLKQENLRGIVKKLQRKEKRLMKRLEKSSSSSQRKADKLKLKVLGAQRKKALNILKKS